MSFDLNPQPFPSKAKYRQRQVGSKQERKQKSGPEAQVGGTAGKVAHLRARLSEAAGYVGCTPDLQREGKGEDTSG